MELVDGTTMTEQDAKRSHEAHASWARAEALFAEANAHVPADDGQEHWEYVHGDLPELQGGYRILRPEV